VRARAWETLGVLLCFINPRVRKIRNEAFSCPGIRLSGKNLGMIGHFFWFFGHIVVFCQCELKSLQVLQKFVTFEGWVISISGCQAKRILC